MSLPLPNHHMTMRLFYLPPSHNSLTITAAINICQKMGILHWVISQRTWTICIVRIKIIVQCSLFERLNIVQFWTVSLMLVELASIFSFFVLLRYQFISCRMHHCHSLKYILTASPFLATSTIRAVSRWECLTSMWTSVADHSISTDQIPT